VEDNINQDIRRYNEVYRDPMDAHTAEMVVKHCEVILTDPSSLHSPLSVRMLLALKDAVQEPSDHFAAAAASSSTTVAAAPSIVRSGDDQWKWLVQAAFALWVTTLHCSSLRIVEVRQWLDEFLVQRCFEPLVGVLTSSSSSSEAYPSLPPPTHWDLLCSVLFGCCEGLLKVTSSTTRNSPTLRWWQHVTQIPRSSPHSSSGSNEGDVAQSNRGSSSSSSTPLFLHFATEVLLHPSQDAMVSQNLLLLIIVGLGLERQLVDYFRNHTQQFQQQQQQEGEAPRLVSEYDCLVSMFLRCCNTLSDHRMLAMLLSAVVRGHWMRGEILYATDLDVLLDVLHRHREGYNDRTDVDVDRNEAKQMLLHVEMCLLRDTAPSSTTGSVEDVASWFKRMHLEGGDYRYVVRSQGIDGEVLWSGLSVDDVKEMGIHNLSDAKKIVQTLALKR
jgi:hypothetical protein